MSFEMSRGRLPALGVTRKIAAGYWLLATGDVFGFLFTVIRKLVSGSPQKRMCHKIASS
jgi:hypothetical protein